MDFSVSVVIPVYNCERYIEKAIASVLQQPEVSEIIVVNDGSTDTTQNILETLQKQNSIIKIYHHENNCNKGRSASRNLAIKKAAANYIAFLDADDYYLPNRFVSDKKIFQTDDEVDGVYNAVGFHYYDNASKDHKQSPELYTVNQGVKPENLFEVLISGKHGHFQISGLSVERLIFDDIGCFNEELEVAEDTDIFWKMALKSRLETGMIDKPVAMRGVHDDNVFNREDLYEENLFKMYESLFFWTAKNKVSTKKIDTLLKWIWMMEYKKEKRLFNNIKYWFFLFFNNPGLLFSMLSVKYFPVVRLRQKIFPFLYK